jgi:hypothetical protein
MKRLINHEVQRKIAKKLLIDEPELIEITFRKNLIFDEPMNSVIEAMSWIEKVGDRFKGFNRDGHLQTIRSSTNGSMLHGVFEIDGKWYSSSIKTGRLFFPFWGTEAGCLANVPDENIGTLLKELNATMYTHLKAEFSFVFRNEHNNNAFFSWEKTTLYGCIRHREINKTESNKIMIDSEFCIRKSKEDFFDFIKPYVAKIK